MTTATHRHVRRLRLSCTREEHARHGRVLLEDALRTATLGDEGRLVIVRRLDLGRLRLRASATEWSLRLEQSYRRSRPIPVGFDHPGASEAEAIYFADRHEPWLVLAQHVAANRVCREWFWKSALPDWHPGQSTEETLRLCFRSLARQGGLPLTLVLASRLHAIGALLPLLQSLRADDLAGLQSELVRPETERPRPFGDSVTPVMREPSGTTAQPSRAEIGLLQTWGAHDVRTHWLAAVHLVSIRAGASAPRPSLPPPTPALILARVQQWITSHAFDPSPIDAPSSPTAPARAIGDKPDAITQTPAETGRRNSPPLAPPSENERHFTRAGGLFFVLPLLVRAGLREFLTTLPDEERAEFPWQVLRLVLTHSRIDADDPLAVMLGEVPPARRAIGRWLIAANRVALRDAHLNLRKLIARPALVTLSPTHIELFFHAGDADIRIRRAGLDLDPGWVPWLGRVVAYHFNRED